MFVSIHVGSRFKGIGSFSGVGLCGDKILVLYIKCTIHFSQLQLS